jgi:hypothetical protein
MSSESELLEQIRALLQLFSFHNQTGRYQPSGSYLRQAQQAGYVEAPSGPGSAAH